MDNIIFCNSFLFRTITCRSPRHTDNSKGIDRSFFAKMTSGNGRIVTLSGEELQIAVGDIFYLPKGLRYHSYWQPSEDGPAEWDSFGFELLPLPGGERFTMQKIEADNEAYDLLENIKKGNPVRPEDVAYLYLFASRVIPKMKRDFEEPTDKIIEKARNYISKNLDFKVPELARHCSMSESSLFALFRERIGKTPIEIKQEIQIERAISLLGSGDMSIEQVGSLSGFHSTPYFRKIFKEQTGLSPTEKRRELLYKNSL